MHRKDLKSRSVKLRLEGKTLTEICEMLTLPKSTVYGWVKDLPKPQQTPEKATAAKQQALIASMVNQTKCSEARDNAYATGVEEWQKHSLSAGFRDFIVLYIGEGSKRDRNVVAICNTDPRIVEHAAFWLRELSPSSHLKVRVAYYSDHDVDELKSFWSQTIDVDPGVIKMDLKNAIDRDESYRRATYGCAYLRINDTAFRSRMQAWIDIVQQSWIQNLPS